MEAISQTIPTISNSCSGIPSFSPKHPISIWRKDNIFKFNIHGSNLRLRRPFPIHLHLSTTRRLQTSANFIPPSSRRNSLRKKLNEQLLQQVSQSPKIQDPILNYDDKESSNVNDPIPDIDDAESCKLSSNTDVKEANSGHLGDSVLWNKLETWVDQCKTESEFWGVGFGPIFTIYHDLDGKTKSVIVNEDEILKRCGFSPNKYDRSEFMVSPEAKNKIDHANYLAKETESGNHAFPRSSSVARFVVQGQQQSRFLNTIQSLTSKPVLSSKQSKVGIILLLGGFFMVYGLKALFASREAKVEYTRLEKDMLRRKVKARKESERLEKGNVEVIQDFKEVQIASKDRPKVNKQEVMEYISKNNLSSLVSSSKPSEFDCRIQEIREMARQVRKDERKDSTPSASNAEATDSKEEHANLPNVCSDESEFVVDKITNITSENQKSPTTASSAREDLLEDFYEQKGSSSSRIGLTDGESYVGEIKEKKNSETVSSIEVPTVKPKKRFGTRKIISSVDKAREFLSQEHVERKLKEEFNRSDRILVNSHIENEDTHNSDILNNGVSIPVKPGGLINSEIDHSVQNDLGVTKKEDASFDDVKKEYTLKETELPRSLKNEGNQNQLEEGSSLSGLSKSEKGGTTIQEPDKDSLAFQSSKCSVENDSAFKPTVGTNHTDIQEGSRDIDDQISTSAPGIGNKSGNTKDIPSMDKESWIAENFHEMEQVVQKIASGFSENYKVAREKVKEELHVSPDLIRSNVDEGGELEWMQDDRLREIVFQVRDNELCGRDPFYLMDDEDKLEFFKGLERKVEKENENLGNLHEWIHSNIENLDYGADGISIYDTPEKIIPRWIGPPVDKLPDFLNNVANRDDMAKKSFNNPPVARKDGQESRNKPQESTLSKHVSPTAAKGQHIKGVNAASKEPNTVIEASDGSSRAGKKSGKEYWQHTKKVSRSFLESYNAETDPEVKADMRNIGKDLDRWITEEEVQEAANFMDKIPEKGREYIEKKLNKVKREMELFGPQAVVSKYKEYSEEKEIDYLWWLDLPYILCLELYTIEEGEEKVGFYSLEMAEDLELDPKPFHVIAFEDPGDCKNLCYIVQAQMEMFGNGNAFVVARPPKDTFRDAKEKGFSITVIRKGEMQLNVDLTLEEVEEKIIEIGSKIYHDSITKERSVDINGLMKGVFGVRKPVKRRRRAKGTLGKPRRR